jgi:P pilus assembly chaperone PapD
MRSRRTAFLFSVSSAAWLLICSAAVATWAMAALQPAHAGFVMLKQRVTAAAGEKKYSFHH